ncbi:hypothetical protein [Streptomyces spiralis]
MSGAKLALACGLDEDDHACRDLAAGRHLKIPDCCEETHPEARLLRV